MHPNAFTALKKLHGRSENVKEIKKKGAGSKGGADPGMDWGLYMEKIRLANAGEYFVPQSRQSKDSSTNSNKRRGNSKLSDVVNYQTDPVKMTPNKYHHQESMPMPHTSHLLITDQSIIKKHTTKLTGVGKDTDSQGHFRT